ncbi:MAG: hypothetical protein HN866_01670 [Gammaproteobacteria bacterium]|nr:hypothetical protein [Gammaproteobacteria bacterium]
MKDSFNKQIIYNIEKGLYQTKEWWDEEKYIPSKKPSFAIAFRVAAGGEFFSFLLLAHNSTLWKQRPLCCWHPEYHTIFRKVRNNTPICIIHSSENLYLRDTSIPIIHLDCDLDFLIRLRQVKGKAIHSKNWRMWQNKGNHKADTELAIYKEKDRKVFSNTINYFDPTKNYYDLCNTLKMTPDINFYCWAWIGYLLWQTRYIKNKEDSDRIKNTIANLKARLPKGYNGWTYKNF